MRKIWKMRKIFFPQAAALLAVLTVVALSPNAGVCSVQANKILSNTSAEGTIITTVYETKDEEGKLVVRTTSPVKKKVTDHPRAASAKDPRSEIFHGELDTSVISALNRMGLTREHIDKWIDSHPNSTLKELAKMSAGKQRKVANIATFIRSINNKISPMIAWREASALVYYSSKYNVPTDLSVGIAKTESRFNPSAVSSKGAIGVMQVMWKVHHGMLSAKGIATTRDHMFDPERGVEAGVLLLSRYINAYGTVQKALNRYYGGISVSYLKKVNNNMAMLQRHSEKTGF
ncbi:MAG: lytic transglycosylase domain-containing protein [Synergistaceae bacterium]|jgi:soluble lytic murein transglycosylase-like protein|nr:lytic transglycosylase domain-containing protein [Synergistaceae bacterium]